ncbi:hypothetical protein GCM10028821_20310 [Hymenobacter jeollabukensis]
MAVDDYNLHRVVLERLRQAQAGKAATDDNQARMRRFGKVRVHKANLILRRAKVNPRWHIAAWSDFTAKPRRWLRATPHNKAAGGRV